MSDYAQDAADAHAMLLEDGGPVTLRRTVPGEYDTETGTMGEPSDTDYPGIGAKFGYSAQAMAGALIQSGDQELYLSAIQASGSAMPAPTIADKIVIGSAVFSIASVGKIEPTDVAVLFILQIRGL